MPEEIEAKVLEVDRDAVEAELQEIGAEQLFDGEVRSLFFDYPDGRIEEDGILRIRERGEDAFITLKKDVSRETVKRMEEIEFQVEDMEEAREFLLTLGLEQLYDSRKQRTVWEKGDVLYVIDRYPDIPPLLEIEAPSEDVLEQAFQELGYGMEDTVSWDAEQVMVYYSKDDW